MLAALNQRFGLMDLQEQIQLNQNEEESLNQLASLLEDPRYKTNVDSYDTLDFGEDFERVSEDSSSDNSDEFGDDEEVATPAHQAQSSSEYEPTPTTKKPRLEFDDLTYEYLGKAYLYWNKQHPSGEVHYIDGKDVPGGRRQFSSVQSKYKFIANAAQLYNFERNHLRKLSMATINREVYKFFCEKRSSGSIIHDRTLKLWALSIKHRLDPDNTIQFKASDSWVLQFKRRNNIVTRKITKQVTRMNIVNEEMTQNAAMAFVQEVKALIEHQHLQPCQVFNIDQSRFDKEMHSRRTLAIKGTAGITARIGSVDATSHSYMIMPIVSMDGSLLKPLYILVAEPSGKFPASKPADPSNVKSYASKSANMNKQNLEEFYSQVFWPSMTQDKLMLLMDSWSSNQDIELFQKHVPQNKEVTRKIITPGATSIIQPLDVYFFRPYKNFVRFITDCMIEESSFNIWHRDNFIKLQSFAYYQFSSPRFQSIVKFAFYQCGYTDEKPPKCDTPIEFCFQNVDVQCTFDNCSDFPLLRCAHCEKSLCPKHCLIEKLHIECSN